MTGLARSWKRFRDYLKTGTRQVWVVDPSTAAVTVYLPDGTSQSYSGENEVSGGNVFPGFSFRPCDLFHLED